MNAAILANLSSLAYALAGACAVMMAAWLFPRRERLTAAGQAIIAALAFTALWAVTGAVFGPDANTTSIAEPARNVAWLFAILRLFKSDGRHATIAPVRPMVAALIVVELLQPILVLALSRIDPAMVFQVIVLFRLLVAIGALVLVHNLYSGAAPSARAALRWPAASMAVLWGYDLNFYTVSYLAGDMPAGLAAMRGIATLAATGLLGIAGLRGNAGLRLQPSRAMTFRSFSLMLIGVYLIAMVGVARWLAYIGGDFAHQVQLGFVVAASLAAMLMLPSRRLRAWMKVMLAKHVFQHRYDYRAEWLRFNSTMGRGGEGAQPIEQRIIRALADITDATAGLLLTVTEAGEMTLAERWQWPTADVPARAFGANAVRFFEADGFIIDLDDVRAGHDLRSEGEAVSPWLREDTRAWAIVPLLHFDRLVGVVVLARPPQPRKLDWEDLDLLRVVGRQIASYLAENTGQLALAEAGRFDEFNRRIAFVMHDIKNLASQLSLLARNAELHADKPAFRADMLLTIRNSADKLNVLLARLSRYGQGSAERLEPIDARAVAAAALARFAGGPVILTESDGFDVIANRDTLEQALVHLIQNAVDASAPGQAVFVRVFADGLYGVIEIVDAGCGMSAEFIRSRLFKPFVSSKPGGFGIGAFEARELIRAMQCRLDVESREGLGTRFTVHLPSAAASAMFGRTTPTNPVAAEQKVA